MRSLKAKSANHPLLPEEASTAINVVTFLFASSGAVTLLLLAIGVIGKLVGWSAMDNITMNPLIVIIRVAIAVGYLWTAWLLSKRRELGGFLGIGFLALSFVPSLLAGARFVSAGLLIPILGAIGLALSWSYLDDGAAESSEA